MASDSAVALGVVTLNATLSGRRCPQSAKRAPLRCRAPHPSLCAAIRVRRRLWSRALHRVQQRSGTIDQVGAARPWRRASAGGVARIGLDRDQATVLDHRQAAAPRPDNAQKPGLYGVFAVVEWPSGIARSLRLRLLHSRRRLHGDNGIAVRQAGPVARHRERCY